MKSLCYFQTVLGTLLLSCFLSQAAVAQDNLNEKTKEKPRVYKHDFEGQDLSNRDFSKQNLDDANFADAILTNTRFENASLKNCNFRGAVLKDTILRGADMTGSDFRESTFSPYLSRAIFERTNFAGVDFNGVNTNDLKFREANLRGAKGFNQIYGGDYYKADLRGADFSTAVLINSVNFRKAKYDQFTRWPKELDVKAQGMEFVETKAEDKVKEKGNAKKPGSGEAEFQKLDKNEDGVLSGSEKKGFEDKDANDDGEISLAEFLGN